MGSEKTVVEHPDVGHISTSLSERHNLTTRMSVGRHARKTNAFSKKIENHKHATALYMVYYNFCRPHRSLRGDTPAMAAGIAEQPGNLAWLIQLMGNLRDPD